MELKCAAQRPLTALTSRLPHTRVRTRSARGAEWEYCGDGWVNDDPNVKGWNVDSVVATQKTRWPAFLELTGGRGPLGVAHEAPTPRNDDYYAHHIVMAYGYDTEYMCWFLNRDDLVETVVSAGLSLVREFVFNDHPVVSGAPERARIQGFLFKAGQ